MPVKHKFVSSIADVGGPTYVQPTHWNNDHNFPPICAHAQTGATRQVWTNMPSAITEFRGATVAKFSYDFTNVDQVRISAHLAVGAFASAALGIQWAETGPNEGSWWGLASGGTHAAWSGLGSGFVATPNGNVKIGTWYPVNPSARAAGVVMCRWVGFMGDGVIDPQFGAMQLFVL